LPIAAADGGFALIFHFSALFKYLLEAIAKAQSENRCPLFGLRFSE